jgi:hypothetical protein
MINCVASRHADSRPTRGYEGSHALYRIAGQEPAGIERENSGSLYRMPQVHPRDPL